MVISVPPYFLGGCGIWRIRFFNFPGAGGGRRRCVAAAWWMSLTELAAFCIMRMCN